MPKKLSVMDSLKGRNSLLRSKATLSHIHKCTNKNIKKLAHTHPHQKKRKKEKYTHAPIPIERKKNCAVHTAHKKIAGTWIFPFLYANFLISEFTKQRIRLARGKNVYYKRVFFYAMRVSFIWRVLYITFDYAVANVTRLKTRQYVVYRPATNGSSTQLDQPLTLAEVDMK
jgi:hypothetical protein